MLTTPAFSQLTFKKMVLAVFSRCWHHIHMECLCTELEEGGGGGRGDEYVRCRRQLKVYSRITDAAPREREHIWRIVFYFGSALSGGGTILASTRTRARVAHALRPAPCDLTASPAIALSPCDRVTSPPDTATATENVDWMGCCCCRRRPRRKVATAATPCQLLKSCCWSPCWCC